MALTIQIRDDFWDASSVPLEVDSIASDRLTALNLDQIKRCLIWQGKSRLELGEAFHVSGSLSDLNVVWQGDLARVHWIGAKHRLGSLRIEGNAGRHLGSQMTGGAIEVVGNADDFAGVEMTGGRIHISGNGGNRIGGRYPGSKYGMNRGTILVEGNVGHGLGENMRRGSIVVGGDAGDCLGWNMLAGTICIFGAAGTNVGAGMVRGTIVCGGNQPDLLPTFVSGAEVFETEWMRIFANWLADQNSSWAGQLLEKRYRVYSGDLLYGGRGEVWMAI